jgi:hypothetical protein
MTEQRLVYRKVGDVEAWMSVADDGIEVTVYDASTQQWTRTLVRSFTLAYRMVNEAAQQGAQRLAEVYRGI